MKRIAIYSFALLTLIVIGYAASLVYHERSRVSRYERLSRGISKPDVLNSFGQPDEIRVCDSSSDCKDYFIYLSFMERWGVVFDNEDRVIDKFYNGGSF